MWQVTNSDIWAYIVCRFSTKNSWNTLAKVEIFVLHECKCKNPKVKFANWKVTKYHMNVWKVSTCGFLIISNSCHAPFSSFEATIITNSTQQIVIIQELCPTFGAIHKLRRQDFANFWPPLPLRRQVYYISLCSSIGIWLTRLPT